MKQFAVRVSFVEFYLDNVYDLISNDNKVFYFYNLMLGKNILLILETRTKGKRRKWSIY